MWGWHTETPAAKGQQKMQSSFENGGCSHYSVQIGCLESLFHALTHGNIYQSLLFFLTVYFSHQIAEGFYWAGCLAELADAGGKAPG